MADGEDERSGGLFQENRDGVLHSWSGSDLFLILGTPVLLVSSARYFLMFNHMLFAFYSCFLLHNTQNDLELVFHELGVLARSPAYGRKINVT